MHPGYANAMPPTPPGYPYFPAPQPHYWQPPEVHTGTPHEFDAYGNQTVWPDQSVEPDQGWTNENDNSAEENRDFDVVEVARKVLPPPPKSLPMKPQLVSDGSKPSSTNLGGSPARASVPSPKATLIKKNMLEKSSSKSTPIEPLINQNMLEKSSSKSNAIEPLVNKNMLEQKSISIEHIHVPMRRDASLGVETKEHPNLAPFEMGQEYTGDTFWLLTATTKPPPGRVLIGPDYRRSKPPIEASTHVIVAIIHSEILKHWSGFKITIYESSITGHYFDSLNSNREGRARKAKSDFEEQLQRWFQQVGKKNQAKIDLVIIVCETYGIVVSKY